MRRFLLLMLLTLGLAGVSSGQPPAPLPPTTSDLIPLGMPAALVETPLDLETALQWTLSSNPELVALRQNLSVSAAAMEVARRFPMSLNPSVSVDARPWTFERNTGQGARPLDAQVSVSWMQPIELGNRTGHRLSIAQAAYNQTHWNILQAELLALVQTFRLHQSALYRREKLGVARQLAEFNVQLLQSVRRQMEAGLAPATDLVLAEVENQSMTQRLQTAEQEYLDALTELRKQLGMPQCADSAMPSGELKIPAGVVPADEDNLTRIALESHPEINAAQAQASASHAAVCLARADRIPVPSVGPVFERDESGTSFYGMVLSTPVPVFNSGKTLVCQRETEHSRDLAAVEQLRVRTIVRVKASLTKWNQTKDLVNRVFAATQAIQAQAEKMDRLYAAGQTDLLKLLQVHQRLIEAENARLDMVWQATQAYADLLAATGATPLLGAVSPAADRR